MREIKCAFYMSLVTSMQVYGRFPKSASNLYQIWRSHKDNSSIRRQHAILSCLTYKNHSACFLLSHYLLMAYGVAKNSHSEQGRQSGDRVWGPRLWTHKYATAHGDVWLTVITYKHNPISTSLLETVGLYCSSVGSK